MTASSGFCSTSYDFATRAGLKDTLVVQLFLAQELALIHLALVWLLKHEESVLGIVVVAEDIVIHMLGPAGCIGRKHVCWAHRHQ